MLFKLKLLNYFIKTNKQLKKKQSDNSSDSENELVNKETFAFFTSQLRVSKVIFTTVPIEYPETSPEGVATVYNVTGWNHTEAFSDISILLIFQLV